MRDHDEDDEDSYRRYGEHNSMGLDNKIKENVGMNHEGKVQVYGWSFDVGPELAPLVRPFVDQAISQLSINGAKHARKFGTDIAASVLSESNASRVGKAAYLSWMFGLPAADVALGIKNTVRDGFKNMYALEEEAQPLLAANNKGEPGLSTLLTSKFTVLAKARAKIMEKSKSELAGTIAGGVRVAPNIAMAVYQNQLDNIAHPELYRQENTFKGMSVQKKQALEREIANLESRQAKDPKALRESSISSADGHNNPVQGLIHSSKDHPFTLKPKTQEDYHHNIQFLKWTPALAGVAGELIDKHIAGKDTPDTAWDKIIELQHVVHQHTHPDQERVAVMVKDIFAQHAHDLKKSYSIDGDPLDKTANLIAEAIVKSHLHPQAIAEMLDNKKIVSFGKTDVDFGEPAEVKEQLTLLLAKYNGRIGEKEVYKSAEFTKKTLPDIYKNIPPDEKPFFTALFPIGVLERAGVPKEEVAKNRELAADHLTDTVIERLRLMMEVTPEQLKAHGIKNKYIDSLDTMRHAFHTADSDGEAAQYVGENQKDVTKLLRNIEASVKKPEQMWKDFVSHNEIEALKLPATANDAVFEKTEKLTTDGSLPSRGR